jgi:two-component system chemotaxis response regulator CheB
MPRPDPKVRVLIVDDSAIVRKMLADTISAGPTEVVGVAGIPLSRDLIVRHRPDVLTLDIEMPRMDGPSVPAQAEHRPMPVIVVSSVTPGISREHPGPGRPGDRRHRQAGRTRSVRSERLKRPSASSKR